MNTPVVVDATGLVEFQGLLGRPRAAQQVSYPDAHGPHSSSTDVALAVKCAPECQALRCQPRSYQRLLWLTTRTTSSITGTSINTPTTVASAAPDSNPNRLMAAATASSKKLEAPIRAEGQATRVLLPQPCG